jgi:hypothetical protein
VFGEQPGLKIGKLPPYALHFNELRFSIYAVFLL